MDFGSGVNYLSFGKRVMDLGSGQFLRFEIKDGLDTFFWHDDWLQLGKLIDITGPAGPNLFGIPLNAKVADALGNERWRARCSHSRQFSALRASILAMPFNPGQGNKDKVLWRHSKQEYNDRFNDTLGIKFVW